MRPYIEAIGKVSSAYTICYPNAGRYKSFIGRCMYDGLSAYFRLVGR